MTSRRPPEYAFLRLQAMVDENSEGVGLGCMSVGRVARGRCIQLEVSAAGFIAGGGGAERSKAVLDTIAKINLKKDRKQASRLPGLRQPTAVFLTEVQGLAVLTQG